MNRKDLIRWAMYGVKLEGASASRDRLILVHLVLQWNEEHGVTFPTIPDIASALGISTDPVRRGLRSLEEQGAIVLEGYSDAVAHIPGGRRPRVWKFTAGGK